MKNIKELVNFLFLLLGIQPPRRIPTIDNFESWAVIPSVEHKINMLKAIIKRARIKKDHDYYDLILKTYIPDIDLSYREAKFVGYGEGKENTNCYRQLISKAGHSILFEKAYFTDSEKLHNLLWFEENILEKKIGKLVTPRIINVFKSSFLTIINFEYLTLEVIDEKKLSEKLNLTALALYDSSIDLAVIMPDFLKDFTKHNYYKRNIDKAANKLIDIDVCAFIDDIKKGLYVLSHGDLSESNVYQDGVVIDWDSCGFFPFGLDVAKIYYRMIVNHAYKVDFEAWLIENYKKHIKSEHWLALYKNFIFFLFVFIQDSSLKPSSKLQELELHLLTKLVVVA